MDKQCSYFYAKDLSLDTEQCDSKFKSQKKQFMVIMNKLQNPAL